MGDVGTDLGGYLFWRQTLVLPGKPGMAIKLTVYRIRQRCFYRSETGFCQRFSDNGDWIRAAMEAETTFVEGVSGVPRFVSKVDEYVPGVRVERQDVGRFGDDDGVGEIVEDGVFPSSGRAYEEEFHSVSGQ
jgi:hypothetical protein